MIELFKIFDLLKKCRVIVDEKRKTIKLKNNERVLVEVVFYSEELFEIVKRYVS